MAKLVSSEVGKMKPGSNMRKHERLDVYQELIPPNTWAPMVRKHFDEVEALNPSWFNLASLSAEKFSEFKAKMAEFNSAGPLREEQIVLGSPVGR